MELQTSSATNRPPDPLDRRLGGTAPLPLSARKDIINRIFQLALSISDLESRYDGFNAYFDWYEEQCEAAASQVSVRTHGELLELLKLVQSASRDAQRSKIADQVCIASRVTGTASDQIVDASIALAVTIWLSISIDSLQHFVRPGRCCVWSNGQCLHDAVNSAFSPQAQTSETVKLPKTFTAANLERIAGIKVQWTSNLADHLLLRDDGTKVMLYHQVSFLEMHQKSKLTKLPLDLIEETLRTLSLLIPSSDARSRRWFKKKRRKLHLDSRAGSYGALNTSARQIDSFHYWRDQLVILKQAFDESEPHGLSRWWHDDRKKVQWYTFWVAALILLLTVVFGLTQSIAGIVQAWAAVKAWGKT